MLGITFCAVTVTSIFKMGSVGVTVVVGVEGVSVAVELDVGDGVCVSVETIRRDGVTW